MSAGLSIHFPEGTSDDEQKRARKALDRSWPEHYRSVEFTVGSVEIEQAVAYVRYSFATLHCSRCGLKWRVWTRADGPREAEKILEQTGPAAWECPRCPSLRGAA